MPAFPPARRSGAFTLVELMVATVVLLIILLMLVAMVNQTATIWRSSTAKVEQFRAARTAFESITRNLSQATLNTYYDYYTPPGSNVPLKYYRASDLRFVAAKTTDVVPKGSDGTAKAPTPGPGHSVFFSAPLGYTVNNPSVGNFTGMESLLNTWGYFIEYGSDYNFRPPFLSTGGSSFQLPPERYRYRLMEMMVPSEQISIYRYTSNAPTQSKDYYNLLWFQDALSLPPTASTGTGNNSAARPVHLLAENIITMVIYPQLSAADQRNLTQQGVNPAIAPGYTYDTTPQPQAKVPTDVTSATDPSNQLPPVVQVTLIALDEGSAQRLERQKDQGDRSKPPAIDENLQQKYFQSDKINPGQPRGASNNAAANYDTDLKNLQDELSTKYRLTYRVFTSNVSLRGAKWSRN